MATGAYTSTPAPRRNSRSCSFLSSLRHEVRGDILWAVELDAVTGRPRQRRRGVRGFFPYAVSGQILRSGHVAPPRVDKGTASVFYLDLIAMGGLERERR